MSSCSRCFESSKQAKLSERIDRISSLPDQILGHILSFLPTKHAVKTSVLSHRWQYLFTLITNFDFDEKLVFSSGYSVPGYHDLSESKLHSLYEKYLKGHSAFKYFVDRVLMLCKPTHINKFRLNCVQSYDSNRIKRWIEFALLKGVSELDVFNSQFNSSVTQQIFVCATLAVLKLYGKFEMKLPESYFLPNLKFLQLKSGCFPKNFPLNRLMSICPMLEDLVLGGRWGDYVKVINISSPTLINLTLNFITTSNYDRPRTDVLLDLPNLLYFDYEDILAIHYSMNLNSLVDARIRTALTGRRYDPDDESPQNFSDSMIELLKGVSSAKHLYLSGGLQVLSFGEDKLPSFYLGEYKRLPSFNHLSCLDIDLSSQCGIWEHFLLAFLHSSPVLENLVIPGGLPASSFIYVSKSKSKSRSKTCFWDGLKTPPSCLSSHLKTISIRSFHAQEYEELGVTKYFLKYGKVLTKLILYCKLKSEKEYTELKQLFKIGRLASKKCSLDLLNDDTT